MRKYTLFYLLAILLYVVTYDLCCAKNNQNYYPKGCSPKTVQYESNDAILATTPDDEQYRVFIIQTISSVPIQLSQAQDQNALGAHFDTLNEPKKFSALMIDRNAFKLSCYHPNSDFKLPCSEVIKVCELRVAPVMQSAQGQYWVTTNRTSQSSLFEDLRNHGIFP